jgi:hypothetical protein
MAFWALGAYEKIKHISIKDVTQKVKDYVVLLLSNSAGHSRIVIEKAKAKGRYYKGKVGEKNGILKRIDGNSAEIIQEID